MARRTKYEMVQMNNDCRSYLLLTNLDYQKAFEMMVKECLEAGRKLPYYIKGIQDFKTVAQELAIELNQEAAMKKADKERYTAKQSMNEYILNISYKDAMELYKANKDNVSDREKMALVDMVTAKHTNDFNEKYIDEVLVRVVNKLVPNLA